MKQHANAALSLNGRRRMVLRVVEEGWSISEDAECQGRTKCVPVAPVEKWTTLRVFSPALRSRRP